MREYKSSSLSFNFGSKDCPLLFHSNILSCYSFKKKGKKKRSKEEWLEPDHLTVERNTSNIFHSSGCRKVPSNKSELLFLSHEQGQNSPLKVNESFGKRKTITTLINWFYIRIINHHLCMGTPRGLASEVLRAARKRRLPAAYLEPTWFRSSLRPAQTQQ